MMCIIDWVISVGTYKKLHVLYSAMQYVVLPDLQK